MATELEVILQAKVSPERGEILLKAAQLIEDMGLHNHWLEIENILSLEESIDPFQMVNDIEYVLYEGVRVTLNNFSIFTSSNDLALLISVIEGITLVEEYEDFDTVLAICDSDQSDEEILADLLALVTEYAAEDYLLILDTVSNRLISRIATLFAEEEDDEAPYDEEYSVPHIVRRLKGHIGDGEYLVTEEIRQGMPLGLEPALVFGRIESGLLETLSVKQASGELLAAALATNVPDEEVVKTATDQAEELFDDVNFLSDVNLTLAEMARKVFDE